MDNVPIILGRYKMGKTLGIGAFGKVKLAHHTPTGQKVSIYYIPLPSHIKNQRRKKTKVINEEYSMYMVSCVREPGSVRI